MFYILGRREADLYYVWLANPSTFISVPRGAICGLCPDNLHNYSVDPGLDKG
jgi:hypothetical protein